eukprot:m.54242 g.54242  ORF g.54242 m.54242 type:complete len:74 (+) comp15500_c0_seq1:689-910(+)
MLSEITQANAARHDSFSFFAHPTVFWISRNGSKVVGKDCESPPFLKKMLVGATTTEHWSFQLPIRETKKDIVG